MNRNSYSCNIILQSKYNAESGELTCKDEAGPSRPLNAGLLEVYSINLTHSLQEVNLTFILIENILNG